MSPKLSKYKAAASKRNGIQNLLFCAEFYFLVDAFKITTVHKGSKDVSLRFDRALHLFLWLHNQNTTIHKF